MFEPAPLVVEAPGNLDALTAAAERAAAAWGYPAPSLIRLGSNGVFAAGDVVLRVGRATAPMGVALSFADRLAVLGVRAPTPARTDWRRDGELSVTAWKRIEEVPGAAVDWERVGAMVAAVHRVDPRGVAHPLPYCADFPWWRFDDIIAEADDVSVVDSAARDGMSSALERHRWWADSARRGALVLCHGDVHPDNVMVDAGGPVLIDWDLLCVGPAEWDHAPLLTWTSRWGGEPGVAEAFAAGYGHSVDDRLAAAIAELRLLAATLMRLRRARIDTAARAEATRRLAYWRGDPNAPQWQAQ